MSTAVLSRVTYELFDFEADILSDPTSNEEHTIDRQIRLDTADGKVHYVSWTSEPVQYCVGVKSESFFLPGDVVTCDASRHPLWARLMGEPVEIVSAGPDSQIVEIRTPNASVFVATCERGRWEADVIRISAAKPHIDA